MNDTASRGARGGKGILGWLGLGTGHGEADAESGAESAAEAQLDPRERRRRQLLTDICSFLITHRLEVNPYTLAIGHDVITGTDPRLA